MTIKVTMEDALVQPLIQEHLDKGTSVGKQIADAVAFFAKCKAEVASGKTVLSGTIARGYVNDQTVLMDKLTPNGY